MDFLEPLLGPLAVEECRRAMRPRWLRLLAVLASLPSALTLLGVIWICEILLRFEIMLVPGQVLLRGLAGLAMLQVLLALLISPALLAGTIAGEKDRGTLGLLLISRQSAPEIIAARLLGRLSQVGLLVIAGLPPLVLLASLCQVTGLRLALLLLLAPAVAFGAAGLALGASVLSRRGRDALLSIYLFEIAILVATYFPIPALDLDWSAVNPLVALADLLIGDQLGGSLIALATWLALGILGWLLAAWQLWPAYLRHLGAGTARRRVARRRRLRPIGLRPMLWKELFIERTNTLGFVGRWTSALVIAGLVAASLLVGVSETSALWLAVSATYLAWFIQWSIGLRASGIVSVERQRHTWDMLLTSPLTGIEIVWAKIWGSLYALRWMIAAALLAWTAAAFAGTLTPLGFVNLVALLLAGGCFMAAAGVAVSLQSANPTRGMALTMGLWLIAAVGSAVLAALLAIVLYLLILLGWATWELFRVRGFIAGLQSFPGPSLPTFFRAATALIRLALYVLTTAAIGGLLALRFDRLAGRQGGVRIVPRGLTLARLLPPEEDRH